MTRAGRPFPPATPFLAVPPFLAAVFTAGPALAPVPAFAAVPAFTAVPFLAAAAWAPLRAFPARDARFYPGVPLRACELAGGWLKISRKAYRLASRDWTVGVQAEAGWLPVILQIAAVM